MQNATFGWHFQWAFFLQPVVHDGLDGVVAAPKLPDGWSGPADSGSLRLARGNGFFGRIAIAENEFSIAQGTRRYVQRCSEWIGDGS